MSHMRSMSCDILGTATRSIKLLRAFFCVNAGYGQAAFTFSNNKPQNPPDPTLVQHCKVVARIANFSYQSSKVNAKPDW